MPNTKNINQVDQLTDKLAKAKAIYLFIVVKFCIYKMSALNDIFMNIIFRA